MSRVSMFPTEDKRSYFERQRDQYIKNISASMEDVLNNLNALNRSLEHTVGLSQKSEELAEMWSHFYNTVNEDLVKPEEEDMEVDTTKE
ncbi:DASH complex subunit DAD1 [Yarrowia sp. C11]|nr:DASH complex subunit DAD1 [Yarrowia sp. E02]KAG5372778.1 DASH complex subunit DAD1 [Yarrowia sp. C11]